MVRVGRWLCAGVYGCILGSACVLADDAVPVQAAKSPSPSSPAVAVLAPSLVAAPDGSPAVAVDFAMLPHWHIYWTNPGDSGGATHVKASLPAGWEAGPAILPRPQVLGTHDDRAYGYEVAVRVLVPIAKHPEPMPERVEVTVEADWLVCKESCLMGSAKLAAPVATKAGPAQATHAFPERAPPALRCRIEGTGAKRDLVIEAPVELVSAKALFVPGDAPGVVFERGSGPFAPAKRAEQLVWRIPFEFEAGNAIVPDPHLRGLVLAGEKSSDRAFEIDLALSVPKPPAAGKAP